MRPLGQLSTVGRSIFTPIGCLLGGEGGALATGVPLVRPPSPTWDRALPGALACAGLPLALLDCNPEQPTEPLAFEMIGRRAHGRMPQPVAHRRQAPDPPIELACLLSQQRPVHADRAIR